MNPLAVAAAAAALGAWYVRRRQRRSWRDAQDVLGQRLSLGTDGIVLGAQPLRHTRGRRAVLLLHGFGDTPQSLAWLAGRIADAGWTVAVPLLPGHGRTLAEFHDSGAAAWRDAARAAFDELAREHGPVAVCGQSMGACLALDIATTRNVAALVLLAPYLRMPPPARLGAWLWPAVQLAAPVLDTRDQRSVHDPAAATESRGYGYTSARLLWQLARVVADARRALGRVGVPTLVVHSREDNRVPPAAVAAAVADIPHPVKALRWVEGCGHVITVDYCRETVAAAVLDWLERCCARADNRDLSR